MVVVLKVVDQNGNNYRDMNVELDKLRDETYYHYSKKAADISRQLALIGIAAAWIFRIQQEDGTVAVPRLLAWAMIFLATAVALDFLRYAFQTAFWGLYCRWREKRGEREFDSHPVCVNWIPCSLQWLGFASVTVGYVFLMIYLFCSVKSC